jgi:hypothetical protein
MARSGEVSSVPVEENMQTHLIIAREFAKQDHLAKMIPDILLPDIVPTPQDPLTNDADFPRWEYPAGFIPDVLLP